MAGIICVAANFVDISLVNPELGPAAGMRVWNRVSGQTDWVQKRRRNEMGQSDDTELVHRAKAGELAAFEELAQRYERQVYTLALRMLRHEQDAEDATQQTLLSALEHLEQFREEASFSTWLLQIATHAALKTIRKRKGLDTISLEEATTPRGADETTPHPEFIADWRQSPAELAERNDIRALLDEALAELDEKHRLVFLLRDVEGLTIGETAKALGLSEANVKVRLLRARLRLRERLTRTLGDPAKALAPHQHDH
jgi:RNA polymerase sigma-70 factor, ECF subfamily